MSGNGNGNGKEVFLTFIARLGITMEQNWAA
jgi:hypothetical protein